MKRTLTILAAMFITAAAFAQEKPKQASKSDTVYVDLTKAKVIVILDSAKAKEPIKLLNAEVLGRYELVAAPKQYWYNLTIFMKGSKNGNFSQLEIEQLQQPFVQYAAEWEKVIQSMQQKK